MDMGRCIWCHTVISKSDKCCYVCGDRLPNYGRLAVKRRPVSALTNLMFVASLAFTAYCFFAEHKLSLPATLEISSALLLIRILADRLVNKNLE
jgi:hypothetical protein